jgi:hypothetical protein
MAFVPGGNVYDIIVNGGTGIQSVQPGTGISVNNANPQNPNVGNTGVVSVTAGAGISTNFPDGNITLTNTGVNVIQAGAGVTVDNTNPQQPIVSSSGVASLGQGVGITITPNPTAQTPLITNSGVTSLTAIAPMNVNASAGAITIKNNGILGVSAGTGIAVSAGQTPTITNTGVNAIQAGAGVAVNNTNPQQPIVSATGLTGLTQGTGISITNVPSAQTPTVTNTGVLAITANAPISISGTSQNPVISYTGSAGDDNFFAGWAGSSKQQTPAWASSGGTEVIDQFLNPVSFYNTTTTPPGIPSTDPLWIRASVPNPFTTGSGGGSNVNCYASLGYFNGAQYVEHPSAIPYRNLFTVPSSSTSLSNITALTVEGLAPSFLANQFVTITSTNGYFQLSQEVLNPPQPVRFGVGFIPPGTYLAANLGGLIQGALNTAIVAGGFTTGTGAYSPTATVTLLSLTPLTYSVDFSSYVPQPNPANAQLVTFDNSTSTAGGLLTPQQVQDSTALFGWAPPSFRSVPATITGDLPPNGTPAVFFTIGLTAVAGTASVQVAPRFISYSARPVNTEW